jgi:hypothetical protein
MSYISREKKLKLIMNYKTHQKLLRGGKHTIMKLIILMKKSKNLRKMKIKLIEMIYICKVLWILCILMKYLNKLQQRIILRKIYWINKKHKTNLWIFLETSIILKMIYVNLCIKCKETSMEMKIMKQKVLMLNRLKIRAVMWLVAHLFLWIKMILTKILINNLQSMLKHKSNFKCKIRTL